MRIIFFLAFAVFLAVCGTQNSVRAEDALQTRPLTAKEKSVLAKTFSVPLSDPRTVQYKWMPVVVRERNGIIDYCGLVNGKNSQGRHVGFQKFYAWLRQGSNGQFDRGEMRLIASYDISAIATNRACSQYGYIDFKQAR